VVFGCEFEQSAVPKYYKVLPLGQRGSRSDFPNFHGCLNELLVDPLDGEEFVVNSLQVFEFTGQHLAFFQEHRNGK